MSGRDEREETGRWYPSMEEYRGWIQQVLNFMVNSNLSFDNSYTIKELEGFTIMSGLPLELYWIEIIARGVRRAILESFESVEMV